jgi:hypothetical protein
MRNIYIQKLSVLTFALLLFQTKLFSCNLSDYALTSISGTGPYTIETRLCVGGGVNGLITGADNDTYDILFAFYSTDPTFSITSFSPVGITSIPTGGYMPGFDVGVLGAPFDSQGNIYYMYDPFTYPGGPLACVTSTALCGNIFSQCINLTFETNVKPDSIRAFGVEGAGNPVAGCSPNPDMLINFNLLLPVFWSMANAYRVNNSKVNVNWTTLSEIDNYFFTVEKTDKLMEGLNHHNQPDNLTVWTTCGIVYGTNTNHKMDYTFTDDNPFSGLSYYRIKQTDYSGKFTYSKIMLANDASAQGDISIYPNPAGSVLNLEFAGLKSMALINMLGEKVYEQYDSSGNFYHSIDIQTIPEGLYILRINKVNDELVSYKIKIAH